MTANVLSKTGMQYVKTPTAPLAIGPEVFRAPHSMGLPNETKKKKKKTTTTTNFIENWKITNYITFPPANSL